MKRTDWLTYGGTLTVALLLHVVFLRDMQAAASAAPVHALHRVEMSVVQTKPSPPPPPPLPDPPKPPSKPPPAPHTPPKPQPLTPPARLPATSVQPEQPQDSPPSLPSAPPVPAGATTALPMFGISASSTVGASKTGFAVPTGNTTMMRPGSAHVGAGATAPLRFVPANAVSHRPNRKGDCKSVYPAEARRLHLEGPITMEVDVQADGRVSDVRIISGLSHGLNEAAIAAMRRCRFTPADVNGTPVATSIEYLYTWELNDD